MESVKAAHGHLVAAGAKCDAASGSGLGEPTEEEQSGTKYDTEYETQSETGKLAGMGGLAKALSAERDEKAALVKALGEIVPMLERLTRRVDDIARTPLPPLTIAKGTVSLSKEQDRGDASDAKTELSPEAIAYGLSKMSKEEQTLMLIKASYANPIQVHGSAGEK